LDRATGGSSAWNADVFFLAWDAANWGNAYADAITGGDPHIIDLGVYPHSSPLVALVETKDFGHQLLHTLGGPLVVHDQPSKHITALPTTFRISGSNAFVVESIPEILGAIAATSLLGREIAGSLTELGMQQSEDPESTNLSPRSLSSFLSFLRVAKGIQRPSLSLTPDGEIYASWRGSGNRVFSLRFMPDGEARFVILRPASEASLRTIRSTGSAPADMILRIPETASVAWVYS
jgi:hypothetical protein